MCVNIQCICLKFLSFYRRFSLIQIAEATALLQYWPKLPVEKALELVDYAYADQNVRNFAVKCLRDVRFVMLLFSTVSL